jgi:hypothetical protein
MKVHDEVASAHVEATENNPEDQAKIRVKEVATWRNLFPMQIKLAYTGSKYNVG